MNSHRKTYLDIDLNNLKYNYEYLKENSSKTVFTVVKANAYGAGLIEISKFFSNLECKYLATATLDEALSIRDANIKTPILVMGYTPVSSAQLARENDITITVIDLNWAKELNKDETHNLKLHIKINTSMNRLGHNNLEEVEESINLLKDNHNIEGIFTHYCCDDKETVTKDFETFKEIVNNIHYDFKWVHASNSYNALMLKEDFTNAIRAGIGIYGGLKDLGFKNVLTLKSEVSLIRKIKNDETVSYNGLYRANNENTIAILPIGYADGVLRSDSGNNVYIKNEYYKIVGSICMDQLMVKVDDNVNINDEVEIFGNHIDPEIIAKTRNTIIYEVFTSVSHRVKRRYIK